MKKSKYVIEVYRDEGGFYRWRMKARRGGRIVACSGESFGTLAKGGPRRARNSVSAMLFAVVTETTMLPEIVNVPTKAQY